MEIYKVRAATRILGVMWLRGEGRERRETGCPISDAQAVSRCKPSSLFGRFRRLILLI